MSLRTDGFHHGSIRTTDLGRAKRFYTDTLGFQPVLETEAALLLDAHGTLFGLWGPAQKTSPGDRFDPFRVGLDHLALTVPNAELLHELKEQLDDTGRRGDRERLASRGA
jgi:catechol 2,3-dioxygenase-like lactoylglutathione lyase family enzyme